MQVLTSSLAATPPKIKPLKPLHPLSKLRTLIQSQEIRAALDLID